MGFFLVLSSIQHVLYVNIGNSVVSATWFSMKRQFSMAVLQSSAFILLSPHKQAATIHCVSIDPYEVSVVFSSHSLNLPCFIKFLVFGNACEGDCCFVDLFFPSECGAKN